MTRPISGPIPRLISRRHAIAGLCSLVAAPAAFAADEAWPARPVRLIVPYAAGGNADATARALSTQLAERLGQQVLVDNRPGGGGTIGAAAAAKSPADGYTLLLDATAFAVNPVLLPRLPYGGPSDFAPVSLLTRAPLLLVVPAQSPFRTAADLVRHAKTRPGKLSYASAGNGGAQHLAGELFKQSARISMVHIPYRGGAPALTDLIAGQVDLMFSATSASGPFVRGGKLRALGVASARRVEAFPGRGGRGVERPVRPGGHPRGGPLAPGDRGPRAGQRPRAVPALGRNGRAGRGQQQRRVRPLPGPGRPALEPRHQDRRHPAGLNRITLETP